MRRALAPAERRRAARRAALALARACRHRGARHVAVFLSFGGEIDTTPLIAQLHRQGCRLYVPRLAGNGQMHLAAARAPLRRNRYGIAEPVRLARPPRLDLVVLPLVAFDAQGRRLGLGGGYYDRWLARTQPRCPRVGYAFALQEVPAVPADARDARLDAVVTERGYRRFTRPT